MSRIKFTVYGSPVPQGRPRFARVGKFVKTYDPKPSRDWKESVRWQAVKSGAGTVLEGALIMRLVFRLPRPKSLPKKVKHHVKKPDVDNLCKGIKDALEGICYERDQQIVHLDARKEYVAEGYAPGVLVEIEEIKKP